MASVWSWLMLHGKDVVLALLVIDGYLIQIFPNARLLQKAKELLTGVSGG